MHHAVPYLVANMLALVIFLPWLPTAWEQVTNWPNTGTTLPIMEAVGTILAYLAFGITVGTGTTITVVFFLLFGLIHLPRGRVFNTLVPVVWVIVPVGLFLTLGLFREANLKFLLPAQIGFALWMGRGISVLWDIQPRRTVPLLRLAPKAAAAAGLVGLVGMLATELNPLYIDYRRDDYRGIVQRIESSSRSGDAIILAAPNQEEVFGYYYDGDLPVYPLPRGLGGDDTATLAETRQIIAEHDQIFAVLWGLGERDPNNIVENTLDGEAFEVDSQWYGNVRLVRYTTPAEFDTVMDAGVTFGDHITLETYALNGDAFAPGDVLQLRLAWSTDATLDIRYKVFVQLLNPDGFLVAQRDAEPGGGLQPTTIWSPGETVYDNHALILPDDLVPSHYNLIIGLYNADVRLALENNADFLTLAEITINQEH